MNAIALLYDQVNQAEKFRLILGNLMQEEAQIRKQADLLNGNNSFANTLTLSPAAKRTVEFLLQDKVSVKSIQRNFYHAKTYIYQDKDSRKNFHIITWKRSGGHASRGFMENSRRVSHRSTG